MIGELFDRRPSWDISYDMCGVRPIAADQLAICAVVSCRSRDRCFGAYALVLQLDRSCPFSFRSVRFWRARRRYWLPSTFDAPQLRMPALARTCVCSFWRLLRAGLTSALGSYPPAAPPFRG